MRMVRCLAVIGAVFIVGLVGAAPALSETTSMPRTSAAVVAAQNAPAAVIADPAGPTTTIAPAPVVDVNPTSEGMPGANLVKQLLSWLAQLALWGSLASILAGATVYGLAQNAANYNGAYRGKQLAVAGAIGAALAGLAPTAISMLFRAARAG